MSNTRRQFVKGSVTMAVGASTGSLAAPWLWAKNPDAQPDRRPTMVVIYLRGGADPLNTIIPYEDRSYYELRPSISIAHPKDAGRGQPTAIPINRHFALHPALAPLAPLYRQGKLAAIVNAGSTHPTRSHFDAQDFMERAAPGVKTLQEGWLNRYLYLTRSPNDHYLRALSLQPLLPRSLRGRYAVLAAPGPGSDEALTAFEKLYGPCDDYRRLIHERDKQQQEMELQYKNRRAAQQREAIEAGAGMSALTARDPGPKKRPIIAADLHDMISRAGINTVQKLRRLNYVLGQTSKSTDYPAGGLGHKLRDVATVLKAGEPIEITALDYNGWDHHSYQGGSEGRMANMLDHLAKSIAAFVADLGTSMMKQVMILTMSEFGRTVKENGSNGSDHGHGGFMLAIGGMVNGGKIYGKWTGLASDDLHLGRDLPVFTDFRDVFAETLLGLYGFDASAMDFFPGHKPLYRPLGLLKVGSR